MMVLSLCIYVRFDSFCEIFNADLIRLGCFFTPVSGGRFAHEIHVYKDIHYCILDEVELMPVFLPRLPVFIFKRFFEFIHTAGFRKLLLQIRQMRKRTAKALHLIEDAKEYVDDGIFILLAACVALGIDVKKHHIGRCFRGKPHIRKHHRVSDFLIFHKIVKRSSVSDLLVLKKIGQNLQEV